MIGHVERLTACGAAEVRALKVVGQQAPKAPACRRASKSLRRRRVGDGGLDALRRRALRVGLLRLPAGALRLSLFDADRWPDRVRPSKARVEARLRPKRPGTWIAASILEWVNPQTG